MKKNKEDFDPRPEPQDLVNKLSIALEREIEVRVERVKTKLGYYIDLEERIREEMSEEGLHFEGLANEDKIHEVFTEIFVYILNELRYHYFNETIPYSSQKILGLANTKTNNYDKIAWYENDSKKYR